MFRTWSVSYTHDGLRIPANLHAFPTAVRGLGSAARIVNLSAVSYHIMSCYSMSWHTMQYYRISCIIWYHVMPCTWWNDHGMLSGCVWDVLPCDCNVFVFVLVGFFKQTLADTSSREAIEIAAEQLQLSSRLELGILGQTNSQLYEQQAWQRHNFICVLFSLFRFMTFKLLSAKLSPIKIS